MAAEPLPAGRLTPLPGPGKSPVSGAAGEADEPLGVLADLLQRRPRLGCRPRRVVPGVRMGQSQQTTEIAVPRCVFGKQSDVDVAAGG